MLALTASFLQSCYTHLKPAASQNTLDRAVAAYSHLVAPSFSCSTPSWGARVLLACAIMHRVGLAIMILLALMASSSTVDINCSFHCQPNLCRALQRIRSQVCSC